MLILKTARAPYRDADRESFESRLESTPSDFRPVLRPARELQARLLGLRSAAASATPARENPIKQAELFTDGRALYLISVEQEATRPFHDDPKPEPFLYLRYLGPEPDSQDLLKLEHFAAEAFGVQLAPHHVASRRFEELRREGRQAPPAPSHEELRAALVLSDRTARTLATAIHASGGLLVKDLASQIAGAARERLDEMQSALLGAGLIESEVVVVCRKAQAQMARAPSREVLENLGGWGVKCACGRPIAEEAVEEALAVTPAGRVQLERSRWLATLLLTELEGVGVPREHVLIEAQESGEEPSLLAEIHGELVLFELKDREFNLAHAYSFGAKVGLVEPQRAVIVATAAVGSDAKEHLQRARSAASAGSPRADLRCIEGVEQLSAGIADLASEIYASHGSALLAQVLPLGLLDPAAIVAGVNDPAESGSDTTSEQPQQRAKRSAR